MGTYMKLGEGEGVEGEVLGIEPPDYPMPACGQRSAVLGGRLKLALLTIIY